jgi:hypothetical protein
VTAVSGRVKENTMTRQTILIPGLLFCLTALFGSSPVSGQTSIPACIDPAHWQMLMQELRSLRVEMLQDRILRTDARLAELQQQLRQAEAEKAAVNDMERSQADEIAEFEGQLSRPGLSEQERAELEKNRFLLLTTGPTQVAEQKWAAAGREADLQRQIGSHQQYRHQLLEMLRAFEARPSR